MFKFKKQIVVAVLLGSLFLSSSALARELEEGGSIGGGGGAYVCRDAEGNIKKSMLVDLWEGSRVPAKNNLAKPKLRIVRSNIDPKIQFEKAMTKLATVDLELADDVRAQQKVIFENAFPIPSDQQIATPSDLQTTYFPKNCDPEGMMFFNADSNTLSFDESIFYALETKTDVAAAWAHEAIYKVFRESMGQTTSKPTRKLVACLFAEDDCLPRTITNPPKQGYVSFRCLGQGLDVTVDSTHKENFESLTDNSLGTLKVTIHSMPGKNLRSPLSYTTRLLGGKMQTEPENRNGALSEYGYTPYMDVHLALSDERKLQILDWYRSINPLTGKQSVGHVNPAVNCEPIQK